MIYLKTFEAKSEPIFNIVVSYRTGNSFGSEETTDTIEFDMTYDEALENERRIMEQQKMIEEVNNWRSKSSREEILNRYCHKEWFVFKEKDCIYDDNGYHAVSLPLKRKLREGETLGKFLDTYFAENCIILISMGSEVQLSCFWVGYFESLIDLEIKLKRNK